jgi:hypothetical protein
MNRVEQCWACADYPCSHVQCEGVVMSCVVYESRTDDAINAQLCPQCKREYNEHRARTSAVLNGEA